MLWVGLALRLNSALTRTWVIVWVESYPDPIIVENQKEKKIDVINTQSLQLSKVRCENQEAHYNVQLFSSDWCCSEWFCVELFSSDCVTLAALSP